MTFNPAGPTHPSEYSDDDCPLPSPVDIGLPAKFIRWRPAQAQAVLAGIDSPKRFVLQVQPTGAGKSACYIAQGLLSGARVCVLTSTKGLQQQLTDDFAEIGLVDVRGANAYPCVAVEEGGEFAGSLGPDSVFSHNTRKGWISCDEGPCRAAVPCSMREGGCTYYNAVAKARTARLVVTNYAFWLHSHHNAQGLGHFDLLVCDEAHDAPEALAAFLETSLEAMEIEGMLGSKVLDGQAEPDQWKTWAAYHAERVALRIEAITTEIKEARELGQAIPREKLREARTWRSLQRKLQTICTIGSDWIVEVKGRSVQFSPVWPARYGDLLFLKTPKVVLTSATVRPKTADYLGIKREELEVAEYPSVFPADHRPVYLVPTVRMHHRNTEGELKIWLSRIDQILRGRGDRKGIIHTVSYQRARLIAHNSEFRERILIHDSMGRNRAVEMYKRTREPLVLVSPSVTTGYDFPFEQCEFQIIAKVPFPDQRDEVLKARQRQDPKYGPYLAMQTLVQMAGRGMRSAEDYCEVFIVDDQAKWFLWKHKDLAPAWFLESVQTARIIPPAPPKMQR